MRRQPIIAAFCALAVLISVACITPGSDALPSGLETEVEMGTIHMHMKSQAVIFAVYGVEIIPVAQPREAKTDANGKATIKVNVKASEDVWGASAEFRAKMTVYKWAGSIDDLSQAEMVGEDSFEWDSGYWESGEEKNDVMEVVVEPENKEFTEYVVVMYGKVDPQWYSTIPHDPVEQTRKNTAKVFKTDWVNPPNTKRLQKVTLILPFIKAQEGETVSIGGTVTYHGTREPISGVTVKVDIYVTENNQHKMVKSVSVITDQLGVFKFDWTIGDVCSGAICQADAKAKDEPKDEDHIADPDGDTKVFAIYGTGWRLGMIIQDPVIILVLIEEGKENVDSTVRDISGGTVAIEWPGYAPSPEEIAINEDWVIVWTTEITALLYIYKDGYVQNSGFADIGQSSIDPFPSQ